MVAWGWLVFGIIAALIVGLVVGYFVSRKLFQSQLEKNPPISREVIKAMYQSMGRTASEKQINQTMNAMKAAQSSPKKK